jgi:NitT/TauT family transport system ATP-binding protein
MISICVKNLNKRYRARDGDVPALADVDIEVAEGEFVTIVGPSGCGKSTLLYILGGFLGADGGTIEVNGRAVTGPGVDRGIVFQEYALFPWLTVAQNIRYGLEINGTARKECEETVERLVRTIGLQGFEHRFPRELSGGMKQRVAIARSLVLRPDVLLLDEPFGALDAITRRRLNGEFERIWSDEQVTTLLVTHSVEEAVYLADTVYVMTSRPGRLLLRREVELPRPRTPEMLTGAAFHELVDELTESLDHGYGDA